MKLFIILLVLASMVSYGQEEQEQMDNRFPDIVSPKSSGQELQERLIVLSDIMARNRYEFGFSNKKSTDKILPMTPNPWSSILQRHTELYFDGVDTVQSNFLKGLKNLGETYNILGLINDESSWTPGQKLNVCFTDGKPEFAKKIALVAFEWNKNIYIKFQVEKQAHYSSCDSCKNCVRVSTDEGRLQDNQGIATDWAALGTFQHSVESTSFATVYFHRLEKETNNEIFRSRVLHEFGHVLGLGHEHQHILNEECKIDEKRAITAIINKIVLDDPSRRNNVDREVVRKIVLENYLTFPANSQYSFSKTYDENSVLNYVLIADFFPIGAKASCYKKRIISSLSKMDIGFFDEYNRAKLNLQSFVEANSLPLSFNKMDYNKLTGVLKPTEKVKIGENSRSEILIKAKESIDEIQKFISKQLVK